MFCRSGLSATSRRPVGERDETIVAGHFALYIETCEKPTFADRAPRPVGQCEQARQKGGMTAPALDRGARRCGSDEPEADLG
jgi:hypothetical protein